MAVEGSGVRRYSSFNPGQPGAAKKLLSVIVGSAAAPELNNYFIAPKIKAKASGRSLSGTDSRRYGPFCAGLERTRARLGLLLGSALFCR